ncbi:response regulator transcription factor [Streptomyces sp. NPDC004134]|uniref:response regulator transcription factor n=1 Tax=Streptomyces sp. NPDC004134 TaxID=3364691 RepID=UPI0036B59B30
MRILVVEDVRRLADDIAEGLRDQGMAVDVAYDGLTGAEKAAATGYDVVVLDRDLPGLHGDVLTRQITAAPEPAMILMLTAAGSPGDRVTGLTLGADDYLPKPFHFPELILRIRSLARRRPSAKPRILRAAGIELDPVLRTALRLGRPLRLSPKEFEVLAALLAAAPTPLSAEQLLEQVWDENTDPFTKTVPVTVARLRRKLGPPDVILTVARAGYRIPDGAEAQDAAADDRPAP